MTIVDILNRELDYQLRVYKGKTKKYNDLKRILEFYHFISLLIIINLKKKHL